MIKKTILLVTAMMLAATSATYAKKNVRVTNESDRAYFFKVGKTVKKISPGSAKAFPIKGLKRVKITAGTSRSGNAVRGKKISFPSISISAAKANPVIQTNPVSGQTTPL